MKNAGIAGIKITHSFELHLLAFADDMVSMAPTPGHLQRKINILADYFDKLDLKVNLNKTKVIIFRKGGRVGKVAFKYKGQPIEIVNEYTYLGVLFSSSGVFVKAAKHMKQKGIAAMSSVWNIFTAGKMSSFMSKSRLFDSLAVSVPLYASHIWGLRYVDEIEILQNKFMHRALGVSRLVPNYVLRLETGRPCIFFKILKQCLHYWVKLLCMNESRYTRKCFDALFSNSNEDDINAAYNWVSQVKAILTKFGCVSLLNERIPEAFLAQAEVCLLSILDQLRLKDIESVKKSERYNFYLGLMNEMPLPAKYLSFDLTHDKVVLLAQARLNVNFIYFDNYKHELMNDDQCILCNDAEKEDVRHLLLKCANNQGWARGFIQENKLKPDSSNNYWPSILNCDSKEISIKTFRFVVNCLQARKLALQNDF